MIHIRGMGPIDDKVKSLPLVNTTSSSKDVFKGLSPFFLGPVKVYGDHVAKNVENAWQFCKVYQDYANENGEPNEEYFKWAKEGFDDPKPHRFPMGRDARPLYSLFDGNHYDYVHARFYIYAPIYAKAVENTQAFKELQKLFEKKGKICLLDHDGYDYPSYGLPLEDVIYYPHEKMGHSFVLAMMLMNKRVWEGPFDQQKYIQYQQPRNPNQAEKTKEEE
eukprot:TRINITY_DN1022_c0_g1_i1.p1 TRINITY_DN1022_c0_g1~~TRINITY_DN1022_c0_g1_i1.p1  ORF type:complete len:220 (-),score=52.22 TRINITY_DN1022_c0_g1_i1:22-681(-)